MKQRAAEGGPKTKGKSSRQRGQRQGAKDCGQRATRKRAAMRNQPLGAPRADAVVPVKAQRQLILRHVQAVLLAQLLLLEAVEVDGPRGGHCRQAAACARLWPTLPLHVEDGGRVVRAPDFAEGVIPAADGVGVRGASSSTVSIVSAAGACMSFGVSVGKGRGCLVGRL